MSAGSKQVIKAGSERIVTFLVVVKVVIGCVLGLDCRRLCRLGSKTLELPVEMVVVGEICPCLRGEF